MQRDHIRLAQEIVQLAPFEAEPLLGRLIETDTLRVEDTQLEAGGTPRNRGADAAEADDAERRARHLDCELAVGPRPAPVAGTHLPVAFHHSPLGREQQREREIGGRGIEDTRRIRDGDPAPATGVDVHPVVAHAVVGNHAEIGQQVEHVVVDILVRDDQRADSR